MNPLRELSQTSRNNIQKSNLLRMKITAIGRIAALVLVGTATVQTFAAPLTPGGPTVGSYFGPAFPVEPGPSLGATLLASSTNYFAATSGVFTGNLISSVWAGDTFNPFGGLTFTYLLSNDGTSTDSIGELNLSSFAGFATDVSVMLGSVGLAPLVANRTGTPIPDVKVEFLFKTPIGGSPNFNDNLDPGLSSALLVIQTDAPFYVIGNAAIINGGTADTDTYVPSLIIPEPTTMSLALLGLVGLGFARRRK